MAALSDYKAMYMYQKWLHKNIVHPRHNHIEPHHFYLQQMNLILNSNMKNVFPITHYLFATIWKFILISCVTLQHATSHYKDIWGNQFLWYKIICIFTLKVYMFHSWITSFDFLNNLLQFSFNLNIYLTWITLEYLVLKRNIPTLFLFWQLDYHCTHHTH